jgi:hypothetical protein
MTMHSRFTTQRSDPAAWVLIFYLLLLIVGIYGWVCNIITLVGMTAFSGMLVVRAAGILLPPLGAVLGFL